MLIQYSDKIQDNLYLLSEYKTPKKTGLVSKSSIPTCLLIETAASLSRTEEKKNAFTNIKCQSATDEEVYLRRK